MALKVLVHFMRRSPRVRLKAQMHGGGHERGMRSGTLATHQIVGMGEAFEIAGKTMQAEQSVFATYVTNFGMAYKTLNKCS
jgi:cysteine desulfurase